MNEEKCSAALSSVFASAVLTLGKLVVGILTGSLGIVSEAIHSFVDLLATGVTWFAVKHSGRPADRNHHYGHHKVESLAALVETGLLFATSAWVIYESVRRLAGTEPHGVDAAWYAFAVIGASVTVDFFRARHLGEVARKTGSSALEADALHFSSDMWSSLAVLAGLAGVAAGWEWADGAAAIAVSALVALAGWKLLKKSLSTLLDEAPEGAEERVRAAAASTGEALSVNGVRVRALEGSAVDADVRISLPGHITLRAAHAAQERVADAVRAEFPGAVVSVVTEAA